MPLPAPLTGVVPPVCTPLTASGRVDVDSLAALTERLIDAGVNALFVLGSTGEAACLSDGRRSTVIETVVAAARGRLPVLAGALDMATSRVLDHARTAQALGADAIVATPPLCTRTHPAEIADHYRRIRAAVDLPLFACNAPASLPTELPADTVLDLAADGILDGIEDSSGNIGALRRLLVRLPALDRPFSVLTGCELSADGALLAGAHGVVPGLGNVDPAAFVRLYEHARAGDWRAAAAEQDRLAALFALTDAGDATAMGRGSSALGALKAALHLLDVIGCPDTAPPQIPLDGPARDAVRRALEEAELL
ncbi:dihydrodipicolinate synthase family protein [Streptomyces catenulae]|uniref:Dihydrodipicolinate synthase family protein n=1 Tax=Streptomyces catenulae TaxID=66875 RepID=A0ABV2Z5G5_9ACTN|nr:dihydrodipicolinate synthase family protein [Streptomyces catenulae]